MINNSENRITYKGEGTAEEFAIPFKVLEKTDIIVVIADEDKNETILKKDYFVDLDKMTVKYPGYPPGEEPAENERPPKLQEGWQLIIKREVPVTQEITLGNKWPFTVIEKALDKITMILQDLLGVNKRQITLPDAADMKDFSAILPYPQEGEALVWGKGRLENSNFSKVIKGAVEKSLTRAEAAVVVSEENASKAKEQAEKAEVSAGEAEESAAVAAQNAAAATQGAMDARDSAAGASVSEQSAAGYKNEVQAALASISEQVNAWDKNKTYSFPQTVAYTDGNTYRCVGKNIKGEIPDKSNNWVCLTNYKDDFFELDEDGNLIPAINPLHSALWELDGVGNIIPKGA